MTKTLSVFLDLTPEQARAQWSRILRREWPGPGKRQETFLPVEVILSYALFFVMDPHRFGGANMDRAPEVVHALASVFKRPPNSINYKMLNLDGSQKNCGKLEPELFAALAAQPDRFVHLYQFIISAARKGATGRVSSRMGLFSASICWTCLRAATTRCPCPPADPRPCRAD